jgi:uncharacterized repeat protein (TIGR03803 family)
MHASSRQRGDEVRRGESGFNMNFRSMRAASSTGSSWIAITLAVLAAMTVCPGLARAQTFTVLHSFQNGLDGDGPWGGVTLDRQGNLYGTTWAGGRFRYGVLFKINPAGDEKVLYSFAYRKGAEPFDTPLVDAAGNIYGTTLQGAESGTVFELKNSGRLDVLHRFASSLKSQARKHDLILAKERPPQLHLH